jgi:hypothetical protein
VNRQFSLAGALLLSIAPLWGQTGALRIRVVDRLGRPISGAQASRISADDQPIETYTADDSGVVVWAHLPAGFLRFLVGSPEFTSRVLPLTLSAGEERTVDLQLDVIPPEYVPEVKMAAAPLPEMLDLGPASGSPPLKPTKHHWWQIFR